MRLLAGNLHLTPKSLAAACASVMAVAIAWGYLSPERAQAVSGVVAALAAIVVPSRKGEGQESEP